MRRTLISIAVVLTVFLCFLGGSELSFVNATTSDTGPEQMPLSGLLLTDHIGNAYQYILEFLASLPSGTSLDQTQFDQALGTDAATFLRSINVTHISSLNSAVEVTLSAVYDTTTAAAEIRLDNSVTFTFVVNATGTLICDNIAGIEVNANALLGWMPVTHIEVSHDTAGNTIIEVEVSSLFGTIKRTIKLDPNGNVIS